MTLRRRTRIALLTLAALAGAPAAYVAWDAGFNHNFWALEPGRIYRSGQMPGGALAAAVRDRKIRTVVNLRGANPDKAWYRDERAAVTGAGATLVDVSLSSCEWMSHAQLRTLVRVLDRSDYPLLVHCQWGSERTGWVSAVATLLRPGATLDEAKAQFSPAYLFVRAGDGKVMAEHLDQYEAWLRGRDRPHSPGRFRLWVDQYYQPGTPGREQWPYDPKPLLVINPPETAAPRGPGSDEPGVTR